MGADRSRLPAAVGLRPSVVRAPDGYTATAETADDVMSVHIPAADGELAAGGHIGLTGTPCVFDQIVTEEANQRLGLRSTKRSTGRSSHR
ncbi:hypothetical protein [Streptomyces sp. 147326]|uniref:hypothetical protein n=1 Tax=Streptomyces sp. 147326 TaxID=3074379 RepID=UPI00385724CA